MKHLYTKEDIEILKVAEDSLDPKTNRVNEIIEYCKEAGIRKIGIANCTSFIREANQLENILTDKGFVVVDGQRRTGNPKVFAIGDIAGEPMLAHKAYAEAHVAAEAAAGLKAVYDPRAIPAVVFTDPEIAWCGLTETEARERKIKVKTAKIPWRGVGRNLTLGREDGLTKLIIDPETERVLGVAFAGPGAGELIAEGVLAIEMAAVAEDLRKTIHPHPTLSETLYEVAESLFGE